MTTTKTTLKPTNFMHDKQIRTKLSQNFSSDTRSTVGAPLGRVPARVDEEFQHRRVWVFHFVGHTKKELNEPHMNTIGCDQEGAAAPRTRQLALRADGLRVANLAREEEEIVWEVFRRFSMKLSKIDQIERISLHFNSEVCEFRIQRLLEKYLRNRDIVYSVFI